MLNGGQTEHCRASGCVIINGRGWNSDDKRKNGNCATVGVYFQSMLLCLTVFRACGVCACVCLGG